MNRSVTAVLTLLTCLFYVSGHISAQETYPVLKETPFTEPVLQSGALTSYKTFVLDAAVLKRIKQDAPNPLRLSIPSPDGGIFEAVLEKSEIYTPDFAVNTPGGKVQIADRGLHYGGKLANNAHSLTAFSFYDNCLFGVVATDAGNYNIVFLRDADKNPSNRYVVYNDRALTVENRFHCAADDLPRVTPPQQKSGTGDDASRAACKTVRQYYECDYQMYLDNGGNIQNTVNWTTGMFNVVRYLFHNEQISFRLSEVFVWDTPDGYPDTAEDALTAFGDLRQDSFNGDLGQLLSTRNLNNGGLAWLGVLCQEYWDEYSYGRYAYSNIQDAYSNLPLWSWTINCVTHETGHNLGSHHTHWCGWELSPGEWGAVDSCYATQEYDGFQCYDGPVKPRKGTIMSYCHLGQGTDLNLGFGPLPGNVIREAVQWAPCIDNVNGPPAPQITGNLEYCVNSTIQLTASGSGFTWTGPNGFTSTASTITIPQAALTDAGLYIAFISTPECMAADFANVLVNNRPPVPVINLIGGQLKCTPSSASYSYQWFSADGTPVGTDQPTYLPPVSGEYYVIISRNGCSSEQSANYTFHSTASVHEAGEESGIAVWPNPAGAQIFVHYAIPGQATLSVYDLNGRQLSTINHTTFAQLPATLDISTLANGMYILEIKAQDASQRVKFLVRH